MKYHHLKISEAHDITSVKRLYDEVRGNFLNKYNPYQINMTLNINGLVFTSVTSVETKRTVSDEKRSRRLRNQSVMLL